MKLQNIVTNFIDNETTVLFEDKHYVIEGINLSNVKSLFESSYDVNFAKAVIQLTEDQHLCEPRVCCIDIEEHYTFVSIIDIATNHSELLSILNEVRASIELKLTEQLNA